MADEEVKVEVEVPAGEPAEAAETVADVDAARAQASAEAAAQAAQLAMVEAEATVADVAAVAATELESYQERLAQCEASQSETLSLVASYQERLAAMEAQTQSILLRLEEKTVQLQESQADNPPDEAINTERTEQHMPAPEPERPERRRAHRWI